MEEEGFDPKDFILDDKELIKAFDNAPLNRNFVKLFAFNLLKARYLLDNFVIHHSLEDDMENTNPWQLQRLYKDGNRIYPRNLSEDDTVQTNIIHLLSMFEVAYTARQRKNYLFYILYYFFRQDQPSISGYNAFLMQLAKKYFFDIYLNPEQLNDRNMPNPSAFDNIILPEGKLNVELCKENRDFNAVYGDGTRQTKGITLYVFNYMDYCLWRKYAIELKGKGYKKGSEEREKFFVDLGCKDFKLDVFDKFYFSRTRRSLEHYFPQANVNEGITTDQINCFGSFAMISNEANSLGSNWSPKTKIDYYLDSSRKIGRVGISSLKFFVMMKMCERNKEEQKATDEEAWTYKDIKAHQQKMVALLMSSKA